MFPIRYSTRRKKQSPLSPEEQLLIAVLEQAWWDLSLFAACRECTVEGLRYTTYGAWEMYTDARRYFLTDADHAFGFDTACSRFKLNAAAIRDRVRRQYPARTKPPRAAKIIYVPTLPTEKRRVA